MNIDNSNMFYCSSSKLFKYQRKKIKSTPIYDRLKHRDIIRLSYNIKGDPFNPDECVEYIGDYTNKNSPIFSFNKNKLSLRRLLFLNYVDDLHAKCSIGNTCNNKKCCNINHLCVINSSYK